MNKPHQIGIIFNSTINPTKALLCILLFFVCIQTIFSAENKTDNPEKPAKQTSPSISWPVDPEKLSKDNSANEFFWTDFNQSKLLVLKYLAKGRKFRGNIILMPAEGENADHPRLAKPLALQLSNLGWQVFVPNLPLEDYPTKTAEITDASQQQASSDQNNNNELPQTTGEVSSNLNNHFFNDHTAYQQCINQTLKQIIDQITAKTTNFILIGNKNSTYWILESAKQLQDIRQVVLIEPKLPKGVERNLKSSFAGQYLPIHTFMLSEIKSTPFTKAFERQSWRSKFQRFNRGIISHNKIEIEDVRLAKSITGWIVSIQKASNN